LGWLAWLATQGPREPRFPFRASHVIELAQRRRVTDMIRYAYRYVPYYRETMDRIGLSPLDITTAADLARLPMIGRPELQRDPERFLSRARPLEHYAQLQTGGSSGDPITVYHDPFALIRSGGYYQRAASLHRGLLGRRFGIRTLEIGHPFRTATSSTDATLARLSLLTGARRRIVSILDPVERNLQELNRFRPHILHSFGSYLEAMFAQLQATGEPFHHPGVVVYDSDAMSAGARALIAETFGIPVLSVYGAYEAFDIGFECTEHRGYHLNVDLYPLRVIGPGGAQLRAGEPGEVVVSNLVNRGTVLLIYRLGDLATLLPDPCPCGRVLPLLSSVQGRVGDWLVTPSGERRHPETVPAVLDVEPEILRYQAIQTTPTRLGVKLVTAPSTDRDALERRIQHEFRQQLGTELVTDVSFVDDLPRSFQGKVRTVVGMSAPSTAAVDAHSN
jgi:phenylacetate-CoA ligase